MKTGTTNIKLNYKPLNAVKSLKVLSGSERQNYNADTLTFEPDRRIDTLIIMVECSVTDPHNLKNGNVNSDLNSVSWKISENGVFKDILDSNSDFKIGKNAQKGQLTIYKNISDLEPVTIIFTAKYLEPISKRVVNFQENFDLITLPIAKTPLNLEATMPVGGTLFVNKNQDGLLTQAKLFRGIEQLPAAYYWYKGNTEITDTNGYAGSKTEKLFIPSSQISKTGAIFRVEVADCSDYYYDLLMQHVEADSKVMEWENLYKTEQENYLLNSANVLSTTRFIFVPTHYLASLIGEEVVFSFDLMIKETGVLQGINVYPYQGSGISIENEMHFTPTQKGRYERFEFKTKIKDYGVSQGNTTGGIGFYDSTGDNDYSIKNVKLEKGNKATDWSPAKSDLQRLISEKIEYYKTEVKLPDNYRPTTKPAKTYKADYLLIKKFPEYEEEVLITQGGIDPSVSSVQAEMIIKTNDGVMQNPAKYFSVGWLKQANGTFKYKGFKVNIPMADIVALNAENKELDYELREDLTLKV